MPKLYYCHGGLVKKSSKKTNQKYLIKMLGSKSTCPKWHFGQIGHGGKKTISGVVFTKTFGKKSRDFL
jgi:hypothetical protein